MVKKMCGVEYKKMQYVEGDENINTKKINLLDLLDKFTYKNNENNKKNAPILINLEKDTIRYEHSINQMKKILINDFCHLKGTYFRNKQQVEQDLTDVMDFLYNFNNNIVRKDYAMNDFSEINDANITIYGGPLACYISHLRAMIYGYQNNRDYTIIMEDDFIIMDTEIIENYLNKVPDDWEIILFGSVIKTDDLFQKKIIKMEDKYEFHSTHFYIIRNTAFEKIFKNVYPVTEQIDVLISNARNQINIYNILCKTCQKNYSTNTQNNLHTIYTSVHYTSVREYLEEIENNLSLLLDTVCSSNESNNKFIAGYIVYDVILRYIINCDLELNDVSTINNENNEMTVHTELLINNNRDTYDLLIELLSEVMSNVKKGYDSNIISKNKINYIFSLIASFNLHNVYDEQYNEKYKIFAYGSSSNVYILENNNIIIKHFLKKSRWSYENKNTSHVFDKEVKILKDLGELIDFDVNEYIIKSKYKGMSIIKNFILPINWKEQITNIFNKFNKLNINYTEFNIFNILLNNNEINLIDYGLANSMENCMQNNDDNCKNFITLLEKLNSKLDNKFNYILYLTFINNIKSSYPENIY
jgi:GR25 family glycosyltransferase involved in LPS biosynthesis